MICQESNDYRLVEATVSFSGVQNSKTGNQFGKMLLKDESTMTLDAIESGETAFELYHFNRYCDSLWEVFQDSRTMHHEVCGQWGLSASRSHLA